MRTLVTVADGPETRLGRLVLAGDVVDDEPVMPRTLRVMDAWVLSILIEGEGFYRDGEGRDERIDAGLHTRWCRPGFPHTYGTDPGRRWTELFAVFTGPLFESLAELGILADPGPRYPRPAPPVEALRAVLRTPPASRRAAEHQLLAIADWLLDAQDPATEPPGLDLSPEIASAADRLGDDQTGSLDLQRSPPRSACPTTRSAAGSPPRSASRRRRTASGRRLQTAATLLRLTDLTHREIARVLGFADEFHLSRRFRAQFGVSPRDYRRA